MTRNVSFPYGDSSIDVNFKEDDLLGVLYPLRKTAPEDEVQLIKNALNNPIGSPRLLDLVKPKSKVAIVVSDITRPLPLSKILPFILAEINQSGCPKDNIEIIFALGNHRKQTSEEKKMVLGEEIYHNYKSNDFDNTDTVYLGETSLGTPINVSRQVNTANVVICLGNIEYHYFAGFTGGFKAILPGVCNKDTITHNHSLMKNPGAKTGAIEGNAVRQDIDEAGLMVGVDFIFNVVLDEHKKIYGAVAGDPISAHRKGCKIALELYRVAFNKSADVVVASAGGFPKDMNLYQTQKAMENARKVLNPGGTMIIIARCNAGPGDGTFTEWMTSAPSKEALIDRFHQNFVLGGHKAGVIAQILMEHDTYLISDLNRQTTEQFFFKFASRVENALEAITRKLGRDPKIIAMPYAHLTFPYLAEKKLLLNTTR